MHSEVRIYAFYPDIDRPCKLQDYRNHALVRALEKSGVRLPLGRIAFEAHRKTFEKITEESEHLWLILEYDGCYNVIKGNMRFRFGSIESAERYISQVAT